MGDFDHILNWTLKSGSHTFPGPNGGTCINEAALVAAGFEYRPIRSASNMPPCFSRPICSLAMRLNDDSNDTERQKLLPFVTRLACADSPEIERARATYIARHADGPITFARGLEVLERAIAMGREADSVGVELVSGRLDTARQSGRRTRRSLARLRAWFRVEKKPEPVA